MTDDNKTTDVHIRKDGVIKLPIAYLYTIITGVISVTMTFGFAYMEFRDLKRTQADNYELLNLKVNHLFHELNVPNPWSRGHRDVSRASLPD